MMSAALGGANLSIAGRVIGRISPDEARKLYAWADEMEQLDSTAGDGGMALVRFGDRV
jgi:hypothetical protein